MSGFFTLEGPSFGPAAGGRPRSLVVLLHGLGADGNDLIQLAPYWADLLPGTEFLSPHGAQHIESAYRWSTTKSLRSDSP